MELIKDEAYYMAAARLLDEIFFNKESKKNGQTNKRD